MQPSERLRRFLEMMWNQVGWNELKLITVTREQAEKLASMRIGEWERAFDPTICDELYAWLEAGNDRVAPFGHQKVLVTEFIGPRHDFRFHGMKIFVTTFPDR